MSHRVQLTHSHFIIFFFFFFKKKMGVGLEKTKYVCRVEAQEEEEAES